MASNDNTDCLASQEQQECLTHETRPLSIQQLQAPATLTEAGHI